MMTKNIQMVKDFHIPWQTAHQDKNVSFTSKQQGDDYEIS